ncbi:RDD family protein [Microbulbifer variabilis]|uniref:RDD family protein n=1 Tax=Microbulbifer variabilis TaxID=266805 RepID=UPI00037ED6E1|nr:RDD family protein [Microbulbifer variabilis]
MSPWEILELAPCDDARAIKRAYAKKLKHTRPDEKPEEFQQLHSAYKWALKAAERQKEENEESKESQSTEAIAEITNAEQATLSPEVAQLQGHVEPQVQQGSELNHQDHSPVSPEAIEQAPSEVSHDLNQVQGQETGGEIQRETATEKYTEEQHSEGRDAQENPIEEGVTEQDPQRAQRITEYHQVLDQVDRLLKEPSKFNVKENWRFLTDTPYMLDEEYNWNLGLTIFERFARINLQAGECASKDKKQIQISNNIIQYCNNLFDWNGNAPYLYGALDESLCDCIFNSLQSEEVTVDPAQGLRGGRKLIRQKAIQPEETYDQYYFGHLLARGVAVLLDLLLLYVAVGFIASIVIMKVYDMPEGAATTIALGICCLAYLLMAWIAESSHFQATPGKYLMGYKVTNKKFERIGYGHGLWRLLSFTLTLPLGKIGWLINCFLGGNLMHDRLSSSHVINMRKSREEHLRKLRG